MINIELSTKWPSLIRERSILSFASLKVMVIIALINI